MVLFFFFKLLLLVFRCFFFQCQQLGFSWGLAVCNAAVCHQLSVLSWWRGKRGMVSACGEGFQPFSPLFGCHFAVFFFPWGFLQITLDPPLWLMVVLTAAEWVSCFKNLCVCDVPVGTVLGARAACLKSIFCSVIAFCWKHNWCQLSALRWVRAFGRGGSPVRSRASRGMQESAWWGRTLLCDVIL